MNQYLLFVYNSGAPTRLRGRLEQAVFTRDTVNRLLGNSALHWQTSNVLIKKDLSVKLHQNNVLIFRVQYFCSINWIVNFENRRMAGDSDHSPYINVETICFALFSQKYIPLTLTSVFSQETNSL